MSQIFSKIGQKFKNWLRNIQIILQNSFVTSLLIQNPLKFLAIFGYFFNRWRHLLSVLLTIEKVEKMLKPLRLLQFHCSLKFKPNLT